MKVNVPVAKPQGASYFVVGRVYRHIVMGREVLCIEGDMLVSFESGNYFLYDRGKAEAFEDITDQVELAYRKKNED